MKSISCIALSICFLLPISASAQKEDNEKKEKTPATVSAEDNANNDVVEALSTTIKELTKEKKELEGQNKALSHAVDSLKALNTQKASNEDRTLRLVRDSLMLMRDSLGKAKNRLDKVYKERNDYETQLANIDAMVYKQLILYPLSIRYNPKRIAELQAALNAYLQRNGDHVSADLKTCINVYKPFLDGENPPYKRYTDEFVIILQDFAEKIGRAKNNSNMYDQLCKEAISKIQTLKYYSFYKSKDVAPYRSIEFLDYAYDRFKEILNASTGDKVKDVKLLIKSITPIVQQP